MPVAVFFEQPVEELEELPGRSQVSQGVLEVVVADRVVDEPAQPGCLAVGRRIDAAGAKAIAGQIVQ